MDLNDSSIIFKNYKILASLRSLPRKNHTYFNSLINKSPRAQ